MSKSLFIEQKVLCGQLLRVCWFISQPISHSLVKLAVSNRFYPSPQNRGFVGLSLKFLALANILPLLETECLNFFKGINGFS